MRWFLGCFFVLSLAMCFQEGVAASHLVVTVPPAGAPLELSYLADAGVPATITSATVDEAEDDSTLPSEDTISQLGSLLVGLGGWSGISAFGAAGILIQLIMAGYKIVAKAQTGSPPSPAAKLGAVSALSVGIGAPLIAGWGGLDWLPAIIHSLTLAAVQVFGHELRTKVLKPKDGGST